MIRATYHITAAAHGDAEQRARDIAREQSVEVPEGTAPLVEAQLVGRVESLTPLDGGRRWRSVIAYDPVIVSGDVPQLVNVLFGNISLKPAVRLMDLDLPATLLDRLGPRFGIPGVRERCAVPTRPLVCTAAKPLGLDAAALAELCYRFARAGADIVKDDHNLVDQPSAPFAERVRRCQDAVERGNRETGGRTLYFPNVTGTAAGLAGRLDLAVAAGCRGVLVNLLPQGIDAARAIAERGLVVLAHPTMTGVFFGHDHGIASDVLLGTLFRLAGADGVIYVNVDGRFPAWTLEQCRAINHRLRARLGGTRPAFPVPGGGVDAARVPYWIEQYGTDTMFLIGSSLLRQPDLEAATRGVVDALRRHGA